MSWSQEEYDNIKELYVKSLQPFMKSPDMYNTVLDFGCGIGRFTDFLTNYSRDYYGCDLVEPESVWQGPENDQIHLARVDGDTIPFENIGFDLIFSCVVLQHIVDDLLLEKFISQFRNRLNSQGKVLIIEAIAMNTNKSHINFRPPGEYTFRFRKFGFRLDAKDLISLRSESSSEEKPAHGLGIFLFSLQSDYQNQLKD